MISAYHRTVTEVVTGFDGFVAKYMGDGVLVYFGYPRAHEDDAERAVRAGLRAIDAVGRLDVGDTKLEVRVGIATGLVVVGDLIGEGSAQEQSIMGETPNLAARLQGIAAPGSLVIAGSTRRQIGELFALADLGPKQLPGFVEPQGAWRVLGESGELSRFVALRSGRSPLTKFLQVLVRQLWKDRLVYLVLSKRGLVLSKTKAPQPNCDIHGAPSSGLPRIMLPPRAGVQTARGCWQKAQELSRLPRWLDRHPGFSNSGVAS